MTADQLRELVFVTPYQPITLELVNGRREVIPHPDYIFIPPKSEIIFLGRDNGLATALNTAAIVAIHYTDKVPA
jgi:hypothetical protein